MTSDFNFSPNLKYFVLLETWILQFDEKSLGH